MLASRTLPGRLARRCGGDAADLCNLHRRRSKVAGVALHAGDELKDVALRLAAEAVEDVALQVDLAGGCALAVERAQDAALGTLPE